MGWGVDCIASSRVTCSLPVLPRQTPSVNYRRFGEFLAPAVDQLGRNIESRRGCNLCTVALIQFVLAGLFSNVTPLTESGPF